MTLEEIGNRIAAIERRLDRVEAQFLKPAPKSASDDQPMTPPPAIPIRKSSRPSTPVCGNRTLFSSVSSLRYDKLDHRFGHLFFCVGSGVLSFCHLAWPPSYLCLLAVGCIGFSLRFSDKLLGQSSLAVFAATAGKVLLYDLSGASPVTRIIGLVVLGVTFYFGGLLYQRLLGKGESGWSGRIE